MGNTVAGNIAKDFYIGNTRVRIATDFCCNTTADEVDMILRRIGTKALQSFAAAKP